MFKTLPPDAEPERIAFAIAALVLPLAYYALHATYREWAWKVENDHEPFPTVEELVLSTKPWISWIMKLVNLARPTFDAGGMNSNDSRAFYHVVSKIADWVNDAREIRDPDDEPNHYLTQIAVEGFSRHPAN